MRGEPFGKRLPSRSPRKLLRKKKKGRGEESPIVLQTHFPKGFGEREGLLQKSLASFVRPCESVYKGRGLPQSFFSKSGRTPSPRLPNLLSQKVLKVKETFFKSFLGTLVRPVSRPALPCRFRAPAFLRRGFFFLAKVTKRGRGRDEKIYAYFLENCKKKAIWG